MGGGSGAADSELYYQIKVVNCKPVIDFLQPTVSSKNKQGLHHALDFVNTAVEKNAEYLPVHQGTVNYIIYSREK